MKLQSALVVSLLLTAFDAFSGLATAGADVVFFETFGTPDGGQPPATACDPDFPAGWVRHNVDGRTPAASVSYVTDAWIAREDFITDVTVCAAFSTSWYSPVGQADDWMVTPSIQVPANGLLSWRALAPDPMYPDGYEVRVSTTGTDVADFTGLLLSVPAEGSSWTNRSLSLAAYAGQSVHLAWRNHSNDMFLLLIDDISVTDLVEHDAAVSEVGHPVPGYTSVPASQRYPVRRSGTIVNEGTGLLTNVGADVSVVLSGGALPSVSTTPVASLAPGASSEQSLPDFLPDNLSEGTLEVRFVATSTETDLDPDDNEGWSETVVLAAEELARDDGAGTGSLGIGAGNGGELGSVFELERPAIVRGVRFFTAAGNPDLAGLSITANLRAMTVDPKPGDLIATSEAYVVPDPPVAGWYELLFVPPVQLPAGDYYAGLNEPAVVDGTLDLGTADFIFTPGAGWVNWPTSPFGDWANVEAFGPGFAKAFMVRLLVTRGIFIDGFESGFGCAWTSSTPPLCP